MTQRNAVITGANGAIGQALCVAFSDAGWRVVGTDQHDLPICSADSYISMDCCRLCQDTAYRDSIFSLLRAELPDGSLHVLINNAATQLVAPIEELSVEDWRTTLDVNLVAPFLLTKVFLPELRKAKGSVINIASIHAQLTKPHFTAYATSKAALVGMTRSMAVELGNRVRVNAISPAAIATPMLIEGFSGKEMALTELEGMHPVGRIGKRDEVAALALFLTSDGAHFINGAEIGLDGGIRALLHDPT